MQKIAAILFDLDGTLVDSARDLHVTLNVILAQESAPAQAYEGIGYMAGHEGVAGLLKLGLGITAENARFSALREAFLTYYREHIADSSIVFDGILDVIEACVARGLVWGIVTNKHTVLTEALLAGLPFHPAPAVVVSGDTVAFAKPHPAPMLHAAAQLGLDPEACLYIGDAERDVVAGKAAGMQTGAAAWGYLSPEDRCADWLADYEFATPLDLKAWILRHF
jgi:2-phosphoglycolate phosphatase